VSVVVAAAAGPAGVHPGGTRPTSLADRAVNLSAHRGNQAEAAVAVNPTNPDNVVVVSNTESPALLEAVTFDGGATWSNRRVAVGDACCDPSLAFDEFGNLFLAYLGSFGVSVGAELSVDGGATFRPLADVRTGPVDQPTVATGAGTVWFTWVFSEEPTAVEARGAPVTGLGEIGALSPVQRASDSHGSNFVDVAIGPRGEVLVARQDGAGSEGPSNLWVHLDADGLGPEGFDPPRLATTTNVGGTEHIPAQAERTIDAEPGLAYDRTGGAFDGRVYLVYTDEDPPESNDTDVRLRYSDDDGRTWSGAIPVSDDPGTNSQFLPRVALDRSTGMVAVSWHDAREDLGLGGPGDTDGIPNDDASYFATVAGPGGIAFRPSVRVAATSNAGRADSPWDFGDYTGLSFAGGVVFPAWGDNSNITGDNPDGRLHALDVYTVRVDVADGW
jgi:hypothetical protein